MKSEVFNMDCMEGMRRLIFGGNYFNLPISRCWICWDKDVPIGVSFSDFELAWTSFKRASIKLQIPYCGFIGIDSDSRIHPTQKPVKLYECLFKEFAQQGWKILDTHLGSGSSRIASDKAGLDFVGFELDEEYFEAQEKRWKNYTSQMRLF